MSTDEILRIHSTSYADTEKLGESIGARLKGGEVIELVSDLGGGKTTFTKGLARGAGARDVVSSPTFTVSREYQTSTFVIAHFDFYRLDDAGIVGEELREYVGDPNSVVVIEWGEAVQDVLPAGRLKITIEYRGEEDRELVCQYPENMAYLFPRRGGV